MPGKPQLAMFAGPAIEPANPSSDLADLGTRLPDGVFLGTSSWSFPGWVGQVWKREHAATDLANRGLGAYAAHPLFRTVSVDRSYYRVPDPSVYAEYSEQVPPGFRFIVKAPASCTTARDPLLLDPAWAEDTFLGPLREGLGARLGLVLLQFPPQPADAVPRFYDRLARFLELRAPWAVEVRTPALLEGPLAQVLVDRQASPCLTLHPTMPDLRTQWQRTRAGDAPNLVIRWNLGGNQAYEDAKSRYAPFDRVVDPDPALRSALARAVRWAVDRGRPVWITANNKAEGSAPGTLEGIARALLD
ncbi:MAG: DUF72 domain-containing protein [Myxococcota bacterium]